MHIGNIFPIRKTLIPTSYIQISLVSYVLHVSCNWEKQSFNFIDDWASLHMKNDSDLSGSSQCHALGI